MDWSQHSLCLCPAVAEQLVYQLYAAWTTLHSKQLVTSELLTHKDSFLSWFLSQQAVETKTKPEEGKYLHINLHKVEIQMNPDVASCLLDY